MHFFEWRAAPHNGIMSICLRHLYEIIYGSSYVGASHLSRSALAWEQMTSATILALQSAADQSPSATPSSLPSSSNSSEVLLSELKSQTQSEQASTVTIANINPPLLSPPLPFSSSRSLSFISLLHFLLFADAEAFGSMPENLMVANFCALIAGTVWLIVASAFGLPVSTSHSLIGALIGCGLAITWRAVRWFFVLRVLIAWLISPFCSMILAMLIYTTLRYFILTAPNFGKIKIFVVAHTLLFVVALLFCFFFLFQSPFYLHNCTPQPANATIDLRPPDQLFSTHMLKAVGNDPCMLSTWANAHPGIASGYAFAFAAGVALLIGPLIYLRALRNIANAAAQHADLEQQLQHAQTEQLAAAVSNFLSKGQGIGWKSAPASLAGGSSGTSTPARNSKKSFMKMMPWTHDLHDDVYVADNKAVTLAERAEKFPHQNEEVFSALQIVSAAVACVVHGSNDVSNAAAPYATVYNIYKNGSLGSDMFVPVWILVLGGCAISIGLTFLGHRVIRKVGIQMIHVTPARGFCVEISLSAIMLIASFTGIPLSSTHVAVGGLLGVALMDRQRDPTTGRPITDQRHCGLSFGAVNWRIMRTISYAWIFTMIFCACLSAALFAFAIYSPTLVLSRYTPIVEKI